MMMMMMLLLLLLLEEEEEEEEEKYSFQMVELLLKVDLVKKVSHQHSEQWL